MKDVLGEILEWSLDRPSWQRDALRRLFTSGNVSTTALDDLTDICKAAHGLSAPRPSEPLETKHLATKSPHSEVVSIVSITHHRDVNALAAEQTVAFGPSLTIVYGPNAAGKSG
jgi:hypothetical protein